MGKQLIRERVPQHSPPAERTAGVVFPYSSPPPKGAPNHFDGSMDGEVRTLKFVGSIRSNSKREGPSDRLLWIRLCRCRWIILTEPPSTRMSPQYCCYLILVSGLFVKSAAALSLSIRIGLSRRLPSEKTKWDIFANS